MHRTPTLSVSSRTMTLIGIFAFGWKLIAGKSGFDHFLCESVTNRIRRGVEEFAHPFAHRERTALRVGGNLRGGLEVTGPASMMFPYSVVPSTTPI